MNWEAPIGGVCTCCDKPIPPRRPSLAARSKADRATIDEMKEKCRRYEGTIAAGRRKLGDTERDMKALRELSITQALRIEELEKLVHAASLEKTDRRRRSGGELYRLVHPRNTYYQDADNYEALKDESASY